MASQKDMADHLDLTGRRVSTLVKTGVLPPSRGPGGYDLEACRLAYIRYLRGICSGQVKEQAEDQLEPAQDGSGDYTALLERERYRRVKRENDIEEGLVAPVSLLTDALTKAGSIIVANLESLPLLMKRHWPEITGDQITMVKKAIAEARNTIADMNINLDG